MDLENAYNLRKNLYDNKDLFYSLSSVKIDDENLEEYDTINNHIIKGKEIIQNGLVTQNLYSVEKESLLSIAGELKSMSILFEDKLNNMKNILLDKGILQDKNEIANHIDQIIYSLNSIEEIFNTNLSNKMEQIDKILKKSQQILYKLSSGYQILKNIGHVCPICLNNPIDRYINCGHTFCSNCIEKTHYCYLCRNKIEKVNKLYFS